MNWERFRDPFELKNLLWPHERFYDRQVEIVKSVFDNDRTVVPAAHKMGKDYVAGFIIPAFFLTRHPCRIVTTSVDFAQLNGVLWGEMMRFIRSSRYPLEYEKGGPLLITHMRIRKMWNGEEDPLSYVLGRVAERGEGLSGHHIARTGDGIPRTLAVADECSGVDQLSLTKMGEWADREFWFGNPYDCANDFKWSVDGYPDQKDKGGDLLRPNGRGYERKVIRIRAEDSPNVKLALAQIANGIEPTHEFVLDGVLPYDDYLKRRRTWDPIKQCVGLDAEFWKGSELLLFPSAALIKSGLRADELQRLAMRRYAKAIGCDPGQGGAETVWYVVDSLGVLDELALLTPDTSVIRGHTLALMRKWNVPAHMVMFDLGGGGHQIADEMRSAGHRVRTVGFGQSVQPPIRRGQRQVEQRIRYREDSYAYVSRRVEMYHRLSMAVDKGFAIPNCLIELRRQLGLIPWKYDGDGRMRLPPKGGDGKNHTEKTLVEIVGCSPDRAEALIVALYCRDFKSLRPKAGAVA